jgi:hypothetical protein
MMSSRLTRQHLACYGLYHLLEKYEPTTYSSIHSVIAVVRNDTIVLCKRRTKCNSLMRRYFRKFQHKSDYNDYLTYKFKKSDSTHIIKTLLRVRE